MQIRRRYKWVNRFRVRKNGRDYWYTKLRLPGQASIALPDIYGGNLIGDVVPEFEAAYEAAIRGEPITVAKAQACGPGTVNDLFAKYLASNPFKSENTAARRKSTLKQFCAEKGARPLSILTPDFILESLDETTRISGLHPAKTLLLAIRPMLEFAKQRGMIKENPADGIEVKVQSKPRHTWTPDEIEQYRAHHAYGSMARASVELLLCQGLRRGDAIKVGPQHVRRINGEAVVSVVSGKTSMPTYNPVEPEMLKAIEACPISGHSTFLVRENGRPFDERSFNKAFAAWVKAAGLPAHCVPHGLRRSFTAQAAVSGCSTKELQAGGGWKTLAEPEKYSADADRIRLALSAAAKRRAARLKIEAV